MEIDGKLIEKINKLSDDKWQIDKIELGEEYMGVRGEYRQIVKIRLGEKGKVKKHEQNKML